MLCNLDKLVCLLPSSGFWLLSLTVRTNILSLIVLTITSTYTLYPIQATDTNIFFQVNECFAGWNSRF
jgi:hypothetical protein